MAKASAVARKGGAKAASKSIPQQSPHAAITLAELPRIGAELAGGRFAGIVYGIDYDIALVDLGASDKSITHAEAGKWAEAKGGHRPTREEARVLWANLDSREGTRGWFWLEPQYAGYESYAWIQGFDAGGQTTGHKSYDYPARAVRRLVIR